MNKPLTLTATLALCGLLAGCASFPTGPSLMALPGSQATFDQFRADDAECQGYARSLTGPTPGQGATNSGLNSAAVGTAVGAAAGALLGSASGNAASGAALGAGTGLLFGSAAGAEAYSTTGLTLQERYDEAYVQCMYSKGHQVPVSANMANRMQQMQQQQQTAPASPQYPSYPPPNTPPPPGY